MKIVLLGFLLLVNLAGYRGCDRSKLDVRVNVSREANQNNPVVVDLVLVYDEQLLKELSGLSAAEWFEKRAQYRQDHPGETGLNAGSWEWVPGQTVKIEPISVKSKFTGAIIFANYVTPGPHRAVIKAPKAIVANFGPEDFTVTQEK